MATTNRRRTSTTDGVVDTIVHQPTGASVALHQLAPEAALQRLELSIVRRLQGFLHGDHRGLIPAVGTETSDARPYQPGLDDVRRMDWAVTARTTEPHVRDTIADRELEVWALLDATASMNWGTRTMTKRDLGIAGIATMGFLTQKMGDRFGGVIMRHDSVRRFPARSGRTALYALLRSMLTEPIVPDSSSPSMPLSEGIEHVLRVERRRGMRIVVSDFVTPGDLELDPAVPTEWERALRRLASRNQVVCMEIVDPAEINFPDMGEVLIADPETSAAQLVDTSDEQARVRMNEAAATQRRRVAAAIRRSGAAHVQLRTDSDWVRDIARFVIGYRKVAPVLHNTGQVMNP